MTFINPYIRPRANLDGNKNDATLLGYWDFDLESIDSVPDQSLNSNDGTLVGQGLSREDTFQSHLRLDGVSGAVQVTHHSSLNIASGSITISAWFLMADITGDQVIAAKGATSSAQNYLLRGDDGQVDFYFRNSGDTANILYQTTATNILKDDLIFHVVFRHTFGDNASTDVIVNNVTYPGSWSGGTGNELPLTNSSDLYLGALAGSSEFFDGNMYKTEIFADYKDDTWVQAEYNRGRTAFWRGDFGAYNSVSPVTLGCCENTPFRVTSGSYQIISSSIDGTPVQAIENVSSGNIHLPTGFFSERSAQNAFGEWEYWIYKDPDSSIITYPIADSLTTSSLNGYRLVFALGLSLVLQRVTAGSLSTILSVPSVIVNEQWIKINQIRTYDGTFTYYIDDVFAGSVLDATHTTHAYELIILNPSDKYSYSASNGSYAYRKIQLP